MSPKVRPHYLKGLMSLDISLDDILYAPIDVGKEFHTASVINFFGDQIIPAFSFPYTQSGINSFLMKLESAESETGSGCSFIVLESTGHYHENLVAHLNQQKRDVYIANPFDSFRERENLHAKTDRIDLFPIAKVMINNKRVQKNLPNAIYTNLQSASRNRRKLVKQQTRTKNIITTLVDRTFCGLFSRHNAVFSDHFAKSALFLLENYPTPYHVIKLGTERLARQFKKNGYRLGEEKAHKIIQKAKQTPIRALDALQNDILALKCHIQTLKTLKNGIETMESQMAKYLIQTPGTYLLSYPGISLVFASDFTAEIKDVNRFEYAKQIVALAGNCAQKKQTGNYESKGLPTSKRGRSFLRATLNQIALSLNAHCNEFHDYYCKKLYEKKDRKGIAKIAAGNKFVHQAFALMSKEELYKSKTHHNPFINDKDYFKEVYFEIKQKLKPYLKEQTLTQNNYLNKIRKELNQKYKLNLL